jgi:hypothetical protein
MPGTMPVSTVAGDSAPNRETAQGCSDLNKRFTLRGLWTAARSSLKTPGRERSAPAGNRQRCIHLHNSVMSEEGIEIHYDAKRRMLELACESDAFAAFRDPARKQLCDLPEIAGGGCDRNSHSRYRIRCCTPGRAPASIVRLHRCGFACGVCRGLMDCHGTARTGTERQGSTSKSRATRRRAGKRRREDGDLRAWSGAGEERGCR